MGACAFDAILVDRPACGHVDGFAFGREDQDIADDVATARQRSRGIGIAAPNAKRAIVDPALASQINEREFARRIESVEPAGEPEYIRSSFVVGLKRLPIRYRFSPSGG